MTARAGTPTSPMRGAPRVRGWVGLHLLLAWLPLWGLYTTLIATAHEAPLASAALAGAQAIAMAALLGLGVQRLTERLPWPRPITARFVVVHAVASVTYAVAWVALTSAISSLHNGAFTVIAPAGVAPFVILGIWLYLMVAGIAYAVRATGRAARAETAAAMTQLAALRAQLNPHFLFNALHTVVQLIPLDPRRASQAAEEVAALLRTVISEDRDLVPLREECAFVSRYLGVERLRFADRLTVAFDVDEALASALVPTFALQTLVENAVRHGAAPRIDPTQVTVTARADGGTLRLTVRDDGQGTDAPDAPGCTGTGLRRLRERLDALHGARAHLSLTSARGAGFTAVLTLPLRPDDAA